MIRSGPRIVIVTRKTQLELLIERRGTRGQAEFYLKTRNESLAYLDEAHERFHEALRTVSAAIPAEWPRTRVSREELDRFLFAPEDIVLAVGQDGLIPNVAKYLHGQFIAGVNPDPANYDGVLCCFEPNETPALLDWFEDPARDNSCVVRSRAMARAEREDGQVLRALNEIFVGHCSHQSARYRLRTESREERQSSSGVICTTGTGGTGWAQSIARQRHITTELPTARDPWLFWFVREPFPSVATGTILDRGRADERTPLDLISEMGDGGVIFADGIETDTLEFLNGQRVRILPDREPLRLVEPATRPKSPTPANTNASKAGKTNHEHTSNQK